MENKKLTENKRYKSIQVDTTTILGSGTVTGVLGKGGFATVYEIWNPKLEIKRAVKLWHPNTSQKSLERFETEIKITAKLHHPNIVEIHNVGEWNGLPYIEMEKINGYCLKDILSEKGALPVEVATAITILICRALTYADRQSYILYGVKRKGIVHCDIKPANIMITRQGIVKLTDFGLATPTDETLHLETDKVNGSVHYSSPEQLESVQVDQRTDIYSLGVVMYEMYSGSKAFYAKNLEDLIQKRIKDIYTPIHQVCRDVNPAIRKIIKKCMAYDRDNRYGSTQELLLDLEKSFSKMTKESPERIIYNYFCNCEYFVNKKQQTFRMRLFFVSILILAAVLFFAFYHIGKNIFDKTSSSADEISVQTIAENSNVTTNKSRTSAQQQKQQIKKAKTRKNQKPKNQELKSKKAVSDIKKINLPETAGKRETDTKVAVKAETILQQISTAIQKNDYSSAERLFKSHSLNDGEYYLLYAQYLSIRGKWEEGLSTAEKGLRLSTIRLSPDQHRALYLFSKAKCLSIAYNITGNKDQGAKAMEAWYDVKYLLKATPSNPQYVYADSEIRRINETLQND